MWIAATWLKLCRNSCSRWAHRTHNRSEKFFSKTQLVKELLRFDFWISRHSVTNFRDKYISRCYISPKAIELFQIFFFRICFYHVKFFQNYLFVFPWKLNFAVSLVASFPRQKPLKSKNKKHRIFWNTEFYLPAKFEHKRIRNVKLVPRLQLFASYGPSVVWKLFNIHHL